MPAAMERSTASSPCTIPTRDPSPAKTRRAPAEDAAEDVTFADVITSDAGDAEATDAGDAETKDAGDAEAIDARRRCG